MKENITRLFRWFNRYIVNIIFGLIFIVTLIINIPTFVLANLVASYSQEKLALYNTSGTFWHGSGLLVATDKKVAQSAPLVMLNWDISLGFKKFVDIKFTIGTGLVAEIYVNKQGVNLEGLNISLSISQVSKLFSLISSLGLSGNINIITKQPLNLGKNINGVLEINLGNVSSSLSPVNPLGTYTVNLDLHTGGILVTSLGSSVLVLRGDGSLNSLSLNAKIDQKNASMMAQFITFMGVPLPDGTYELKIL